MTEERLVAIEAFFQRYQGTVAMELAAEVRRCWAEFPVYLAEIERLRAALAAEQEAPSAAVQAHLDSGDRHRDTVGQQEWEAEALAALLAAAGSSVVELSTGRRDAEAPRALHDNIAEIYTP